MTDSLLSDDEVRKLILATIRGRPESHATEAQMEEVVKWAEGVRIDQSLLELVLSGELTVRIDGGEPVFVKGDGGDDGDDR